MRREVQFMVICLKDPERPALAWKPYGRFVPKAQDVDNPVLIGEVTGITHASIIIRAGT